MIQEENFGIQEILKKQHKTQTFLNQLDHQNEDAGLRERKKKFKAEKLRVDKKKRRKIKKEQQYRPNYHVKKLLQKSKIANSSIKSIEKRPTQLKQEGNTKVFLASNKTISEFSSSPIQNHYHNTQVHSEGLCDRRDCWERRQMHLSEIKEFKQTIERQEEAIKAFKRALLKQSELIQILSSSFIQKNSFKASTKDQILRKQQNYSEKYQQMEQSRVSSSQHPSTIFKCLRNYDSVAFEAQVRETQIEKKSKIKNNIKNSCFLEQGKQQISFEKKVLSQAWNVSFNEQKNSSCEIKQKQDKDEQVMEDQEDQAGQKDFIDEYLKQNEFFWLGNQKICSLFSPEQYFKQTF